MNPRTRLGFSLFCAAMIPAVGSAQQAQPAPADASIEDRTASADKSPLLNAVRSTSSAFMFEAPKSTEPFGGVSLKLGGSFAITFQALDHSNTAVERMVDGKDVNELADLRAGVNLPTANLNLDVQLGRGINMKLESYMSSRNHNDFWVKGGYVSMDASPVDLPFLNNLMEFTTVRVGMYEPNYGDAQYRRSDNANTIRNPFVENYILDAFTTEPGADVMLRLGNAFVIGGLTTGENKGDVKVGAIEAKPAFLAKAGYDRKFGEDARFRLSGSVYTNSSSPGGTLYAGDRTGSNYWGVVDNTAAVAFTNGRINPAFRNEVKAYQINPFIKLGAVEAFAVIEKASGRASTETARRDISQYAADVVYRLFNDRLYAAVRYNTVKGDWDQQTDLTVSRATIAGGWFVTPNMLTKIEYVRQNYDGFAATDIRNGAKFDGLVIQGAIAF